MNASAGVRMSRLRNLRGRHLHAPAPVHETASPAGPLFLQTSGGADAAKIGIAAMGLAFQARVLFARRASRATR
jgi:hypothetical protein